MGRILATKYGGTSAEYSDQNISNCKGNYIFGNLNTKYKYDEKYVITLK